MNQRAPRRSARRTVGKHPFSPSRRSDGRIDRESGRPSGSGHSRRSGYGGPAWGVRRARARRSAHHHHRGLRGGGATPQWALRARATPATASASSLRPPTAPSPLSGLPLLATAPPIPPPPRCLTPPYERLKLVSPGLLLCGPVAAGCGDGGPVLSCRLCPPPQSACHSRSA